MIVLVALGFWHGIAIGACVGAFCGVVLMAMVAVSREADDDWEAALRAWDPDGSEARRLWERHGPYDYRANGDL